MLLNFSQKLSLGVAENVPITQSLRTRSALNMGVHPHSWARDHSWRKRVQWEGAGGNIDLKLTRADGKEMFQVSSFSRAAGEDPATVDADFNDAARFVISRYMLNRC